MLELDGTKDQKEDDIGRLFMLTFNGDPDITALAFTIGGGCFSAGVLVYSIH